jgi:glycosyltransferase involved in cell wall biosynthesis
MLTTHPIQYQVPWFRLLAADPGLDFEVLYCMLPDAEAQGDGFGVAFEWDIPLLDGYRYRVLENVARAPSITRFGGCDTPDLWRIVREEHWDAFIVNGWLVKSCLQLLLACRRAGVPCIVRGEVNGLGERARWKQLLHRLLFSRYDAFLAIGTRNRDYYLSHGVDPGRLIASPYGVENDRFPFQDRPPPRRPFIFLFCGKLEEKKRPLDVLAACRLLARRVGREAFEVVIAGDGALRPVAEATVREHDLPVRFLGFVNQGTIAEVYGAADCLLLPSDAGETWGLVVNEAMASGLPAIVSDEVGCAVDLIEDGRTGFVFRKGDVESLAVRMGAMLTSETNARAMGREASARVRQGYSPDRVAASVRQALRVVI